jgi:hypothetical protein
LQAVVAARKKSANAETGAEMKWQNGSDAESCRGVGGEG